MCSKIFRFLVENCLFWYLERDCRYLLKFPLHLKIIEKKLITLFCISIKHTMVGSTKIGSLLIHMQFPVFLSSRIGHDRHNWHIISFNRVYYIRISRYDLTRLVLYKLFIDI